MWQNWQNLFEDQIKEIKNRPEVKAAANTPGSEQNEVNQKLLARLQDSYQKALDASIVMQKNESERLVASEKTRQENLQIQEKTASREDLPKIKSDFISSREAERDAEITKQIQELKSPDYLKAHFPELTNKNAQDAQIKILEKEVRNQENAKAQKDILGSVHKLLNGSINIMMQ